MTEIKEVEGGIVVQLKDDAIECPPEPSKEWLESREGLREQEVDESLEEDPKHGDIVVVRKRRRWCGICRSWTWETSNGIFRHSQFNSDYCKRRRKGGVKG